MSSKTPEFIAAVRINENLSVKEHTCSGQNIIYLTPTIWNNLSTCLKLSNSLNSFKHGVKEHFFKKLKNKEQDIFAY